MWGMSVVVIYLQRKEGGRQAEKGNSTVGTVGRGCTERRCASEDGA